MAKIIDGELVVQKGELLAVKWFTEEEIRAMTAKLRSDWILEGLDALASF